MDFANPHFEAPRWLFLAVLAPVLLFLAQRRAESARQRQLAQMASPRFVAELTGSHSRIRRMVKNVLQLLAVAGVGLALARPQWGELQSTNRWSGEDVVFALDCSRSMMATDILPTRLQRAKLAIQDFVLRHGRGRFGLVAFAGSAFLQCPLTLDYDAFDRALQAVDENTIPVQGTDVGRALEEAYRGMEKKNRRKLVVLVTDGEDLENTGGKAAESLATNGVVVFTIGVGTPAGSEIRVLNQLGQPELLRDPKGEVVRSRLDEKTLEVIAKATGGHYYPLGVRGDGLEKVRVAIEDALNRVTGVTHTRGIERFHVPLALALVCMIVESLIGTRRRKVAAESGLPPRPPALTRKAAIIGLILSDLCVSVAGDTIIVTNGVKPATKPEVTATAPQTPREFYNAGSRKLGDGKLTEAETFLRTALIGDDEAVQPVALYNLGEVRFAQGLEKLEEGPSPQSFMERSRNISSSAAQATQQAQSALAGNDLEKMVEAYQAGRKVRREARDAVKAFNQAMEIYGATLLKWRRSLGDFKSAVEMNPADTNAAYNAKIVEKAIARLVDQIKQMQQMMIPAPGGRSQFKESMNQLKGRIPQEKMPPGAPGDEEDQDAPLDFPQGAMEGPSKEGKEMKLMLSPEEAANLLKGLQLNERQGLPLPRGAGGQPGTRSGRNW